LAFFIIHTFIMQYSPLFLRTLRIPLSLFGRRRNTDTQLNIPLVGAPDLSLFSLITDTVRHTRIEQRFIATASQTAFTVAASLQAVSGNITPVQVYRNGVKLRWVVSAPIARQFTYSGTTVTLAAQTVDDQIEVVY